jgi:hypothetical protein
VFTTERLFLSRPWSPTPSSRLSNDLLSCFLFILLGAPYVERRGGNHTTPTRTGPLHLALPHPTSLQPAAAITGPLQS